MADILQTLKLQSDSSTNVYPNIQSDNIPSNAVTSAKIADANITTSKLVDASVTSAKIADANITTSKLVDASVTSAKIADASITTSKLGNNSVDSTKLDTASVRLTKLRKERTSLADYFDSFGIAVGTLADLAIAIRGLIRNEVVLYLGAFYTTTWNSPFVEQIIFSVDASNMVTYFEGSDMSTRNDITNDTQALNFVGGDANYIYITFIY